MNAPDDGTLLRRFAEEADEGAFRELVARHLPLVQAVAARQLGGDAHLAEDVASSVFALLARRARWLAGHPTLAGWLFTAARNLAANHRRAESRRSRREQEANMIEANEWGESEALWREVRPLLDEGLARLGEGEREVLLLRFGEGSGYAEIAVRCGLKESAARMRAERALERLRAWLGRRGVTSTAAALGAAVTAHAAPAVAAGAAAQVATQALAGAAAMGGMTTAIAVGVDFMSKAKVLGVLAAVAAGVVVYEAKEVRRLERDKEAWRTRAATAEAQLAEQRQALADANRRAQAADEDNARLVESVTRAGPRLAPATAGEERAKVSRAEATRRFERAKTLRKEGKFNEALKEYLWCFDAMRGFAFFGTHTVEIPNELVELVKSYPAAREAIRARREEAFRRTETDDKDTDASMDFAVLTKALNDPAALIDAMNRFPAGDSRRESLLINGGFEALLDTRSYAQLAKERPYQKMAASLDLQQTVLAMYARDEKQRMELIRSNTAQAAKDFEVLVGVGDEANARALATKILAADASPEAQALLAEKAKRAGRSDWKLP